MRKARRHQRYSANMSPVLSVFQHEQGLALALQVRECYVAFARQRHDIPLTSCKHLRTAYSCDSRDNLGLRVAMQ